MSGGFFASPIRRQSALPKDFPLLLRNLLLNLAMSTRIRGQKSRITLQPP
jgi:hypothetical protein